MPTMKVNMPILPDLVAVWQETLHWQPSQVEQCQFQLLYELILQGNQQLNLTRITAPEEFWEKHLWDSLRGVFSGAVPKFTVANIVDIGTGCGFPGIPVAIAFPDATVTLLDSTRKKIAFVQSLLTTLEIERAIAVTGRVEEFGQDPAYRESYDLALIRAVAPANICAEYALPLLKVGGLAILYRGHWTETETIALRSAVEKLGGAIEHIEDFTTPISNSVRHCLFLRKIAPTSVLFPRAVGIPTQQPLGN